MWVQLKASTKQLVAKRDQFLRFAVSRLGNTELALDVLHDSFVKALVGAEQLRDEDKVVSWFYGILRRSLIDAARKQKVERKALEGLANEPAAESETFKAVCDCLAQILDLVSEDDAEILRALEMAGEKPADYAKRKGLTPGSIKVRRHRARARLREQVAHLCGCLIDPRTDCVCPP